MANGGVVVDVNGSGVSRRSIFELVGESDSGVFWIDLTRTLGHVPVGEDANPSCKSIHDASP